MVAKSFYLPCLPVTSSSPLNGLNWACRISSLCRLCDVRSGQLNIRLSALRAQQLRFEWCMHAAFPVQELKKKSVYRTLRWNHGDCEWSVFNPRCMAMLMTLAAAAETSTSVPAVGIFDCSIFNENNETGTHAWIISYILHIALCFRRRTYWNPQTEQQFKYLLSLNCRQ